MTVNLEQHGIFKMEIHIPGTVVLYWNWAPMSTDAWSPTLPKTSVSGKDKNNFISTGMALHLFHKSVCDILGKF